MSTSSPLQIDIISDFVCPWCFIGKRKLDIALNAPRDFEINIIWRPYRLDPSIPFEGVDRKQYLEAKFGVSGAQKIGEKVSSAAGGTGIQFDFAAIQRSPNTTNAHRLTRWAGIMGRQHQIADALFTAYFEQGRDIGNIETLCDIGVEIGFDRQELVEALASNADFDTIDSQDAQARDAGVTGVPAFLLGGKFVLMGAQDPDYLSNIFAKAHERLAPSSDEVAS
jgi:predicted DsbA family dithiol-disulfide isomerase